VTTLESALRGAGRKILVPYFTGGVAEDWTAYLHAYAAAGADAIEIGLPFSDPMIDGPVVQAASDRALARGATVDSILADIAAVDVPVPLVAMTYLNIVHRAGAGVFCGRLAEAGVSGLIVPDAPLDECDELSAAAASHCVDLVLLAAPSTPSDRLAAIAEHSRGFVYAVSVMGTTGERPALAAGAGALAARLKGLTDRPVVLGLGISNAAQAAEGARYADGVVIGSSLMRQVLAGATPGEVQDWLAAVRTSLDEEFAHSPVIA